MAQSHINENGALRLPCRYLINLPLPKYGLPFAALNISKIENLPGCSEICELAKQYWDPNCTPKLHASYMSQFFFVTQQYHTVTQSNVLSTAVSVLDGPRPLQINLTGRFEVEKLLHMVQDLQLIIRGQVKYIGLMSRRTSDLLKTSEKEDVE